MKGRVYNCDGVAYTIHHVLLEEFAIPPFNPFPKTVVYGITKDNDNNVQYYVPSRCLSDIRDVYDNHATVWVREQRCGAPSDILHLISAYRVAYRRKDASDAYHFGRRSMTRLPMALEYMKRASPQLCKVSKCVALYESWVQYIKKCDLRVGAAPVKNADHVIEIIDLVDSVELPNPVDPVRPVRPVLPVDPVHPVRPVRPVDPVRPIHPVDRVVQIGHQTERLLHITSRDYMIDYIGSDAFKNACKPHMGAFIEKNKKLIESEYMDRNRSALELEVATWEKDVRKIRASNNVIQYTMDHNTREKRIRDETSTRKMELMQNAKRVAMNKYAKTLEKPTEFLSQ